MFGIKPTKTIVALSVLGTSVGGVVLIKEYLGGCHYPGTEKLNGKTVVITGANQGIGREVAHDLARREARVVMACRDMEACQKVRKEIILDTRNKEVVCKNLDLASFKSIRSFASLFNESEPRLDILINNAGVMACDPKVLTEDGIEMQMGVNHFGHFLLTNLLLEKLRTSGQGGRIVNVSSTAHRRGKINFQDLNCDRGYSPRGAYANSKLANILFTQELAKRLEECRITVCTVHPGIVNTNLVRHMGFTKSSFASIFVSPLLWLLAKTPKQGAQPVLHAALAPDIITGKYYSNCNREEITKEASDPILAFRLWKTSEKWVKLINILGKLNDFLFPRR